ncbi:MAG: NUDIX domain-containing protein [Actinobacteria bacterium]|nr:NUDIX domain-containing protein [Actinomycetota bacterium]
MANNHAEKRITAAGTIALRPGDGEPEVLLVHRPRYNDWSLPKGKINSDEYLPACATRETVEETAVAVRLGIPVDHISYLVGGGTKTVYYWRANVVTEAPRQPDGEVDDSSWLPVSLAMELITYADERPLLRQAVALPDSTPLVIVRHGKAMLRANWTKRDQARPLNERGRRQSRLLVPLLDAYGVRRLASSTSVRCMKTLQPHARAHRLDIEPWTTLSEEQAERDDKAVVTLVKRLARQTAESGTPMAICGHRPVLPLMLEALGVPSRALQPGAALVAHLGPDAGVLAVEIHKPRV